ncbi:hypothetical protein TNCV_3367031 [Trichonephila clavipes]|nr:hypothetical protein TNCV_3367031 [Trichonephila clavipes]
MSYAKEEGIQLEWVKFLTFLKNHGMSSILPAVTDIRAMRSSTEGTSVSYTKKNQSHVAFCSQLRRSHDGKHAYSDNVPGTTTEPKAR